MTPKQRDVVFLRWSGEIRRETRDFASLDGIAGRIMSDPDVREDDTLQGMLRAVIQQRRDDIDQNVRTESSNTPAVPSQPAAKAYVTSASITQVAPPAVSFARVRETFSVMARELCVALERRNESEIQTTFKNLRAFQERNPSVIPPSVLDEYTEKMVKLRAHLQHLEDQIAPLTRRAVAASRSGDEQGLARATLRLTAIHAAHPTLLGEAGLEEIRRAVLQGAEAQRDYQVTTRKLIDRQRAIIGEIKVLAAAVHKFHEMACTAPESSEKFRQAEADYLETVRRVSMYDNEWVTGVVLELADLLAEWSVPPLGAENQIDRFLDSISLGLKNIRTEMRKIDERSCADRTKGDEEATEDDGK